MNCTMIKNLCICSMSALMHTRSLRHYLTRQLTACAVILISTTHHNYMLNIRGYKLHFLPYFWCADKRQIFRNYSSVPYHGQHFLNLTDSQFFDINVAFEFWQIFQLIINLFTNIVLKNKKDIWNPHNFLIK